MRILLVGQGPFGARVLEKLAHGEDRVVGAFCPTGRRGDPLKEAGVKLAVPVFQVASMKEPAVHSRCLELGADLGVMAFVTDICPLNVLRCPKLGTIQYHPSLLPRHRGGSAINWAIIQGETRTGITIFWPDKGIDTGPVLLQKTVAISPDDTVGTLYFNKLFPMGVDALAEAVGMVREGNAPRTPQDESQATYEGLCDEKQAMIDWLQPTRKVYDLVRGTNPQPGAYTFWGGKKLRVFDAALGPPGQAGKPGQILSITEQGATVATSDGAILLKRVQPESMEKMDAARYAELVNIRVGSVLG